MEEEILKDCLPHIKSVDDLLAFADYYGVKQFRVVQDRLIQLRMEEQSSNSSQKLPKRPGSPIPGPSDKQQRRESTDSNADFDVNELIQSWSQDGQEGIDFTEMGFDVDEFLSLWDEQQGVEEEIQPYEFRHDRTRTFAKHAAIEKIYKIRFNDNWKGKNLAELNDRLHDMFDNVLEQAKGDLQPNDMGRVVIRHDKLENPVVVPIRPLYELNADVILSYVENVMKSHNNLALDDSFDIDIGLIHVLKGGGSKHKISNVNDSVKSMRSIVEIINQDQMCMARSLGVCFAKKFAVSKKEWESLLSFHPLEECHCFNPVLKADDQSNVHMNHLSIQHKKCPPTLYNNMKKSHCTQQTFFAIALCDLAGVNRERPSSLVDIPKFENLLNCQILVVSAELGNQFIKKGQDGRPQLFVYLVGDHHFHAIPKISGFFGKSKWCDHCLTPFQNKQEHECDQYCRICKKKGCQKTDNPISCPDCNMQCRSAVCLRAHKIQPVKKGISLPSECQTWFRCPQCFKVMNVRQRDPKQHRCSEYKCTHCQTWVPLDHKCYQHPKSVDTEKPKRKILCFDFESTQCMQVSCKQGYCPSADPCSVCTEEDQECFHHKRCQNCQQFWCGQNEHRPNFVIAQSFCDSCKDEPMGPEAKCDNCGSRCSNCSSFDTKRKCYKTGPCPYTCGHREKKFKGEDTAKNFCSWLFHESHKHFTVFAHNFRGYDSYFLLHYLIENSVLPDSIVYNGSKIMYLHVQRNLNIRLLDSLSYFNTNLASLPKMFHLDELKKGWFPHHFNLPENQEYVGSYPEPSYYGIDTMSTEGRTEFLEWYEQQKDKVFDFAKEIEDYCRSDVQILREAIMTFRQLLLSVTETKTLKEDPQTKEWKQHIEPGTDPTDYVTIASICHGVFRQHFLKSHTHVKLLWNGRLTSWLPLKQDQGQGDMVQVKPDQWLPLQGLIQTGAVIQEYETLPSAIAVVPAEGYTKKDQYSKVSNQWLGWMMHTKKIYIQHAMNEGEYRIPGTKFSADGFCKATGAVFEFLGCRWHACKDCFPHHRETTILPRTRQTLSELLALTMKRNEVIRKRGFELIYIWEHDFISQVETNPELKAFLSTLDLQERLNPRDSSFGGHTNATKLYYETDQQENVLYCEFTSLYPSINKYGEYPLGHPEIITRDFKSLDQYFGIAKVKVVPPRGLYHPVLPYKNNGKLKFALCKTFADSEQQTPCQHSDDQREFIGTWCTPELLKAVEKGYVILKLYEVYHWAERTKYDKTTTSGGLFIEFINPFLKIKQESSGWPKWCKTDQDKDQYVRDYQTNEGIQLDPSKIQKNPGLRALSKLVLNSYWGKYAQRPNMTQSKFVHSSKLSEFYTLLTDPTKTLHNFHILNDKVAQLQWTHDTDFIPDSDITNIFLATFTTCHARLKLYSVLDTLQERVLYYDTDSVIFVSRPGVVDPPLGDYLGDLTDELDGDPIQVFVSGGPKNYAYKTKSGKEKCKVRGFTLNYANSQIINFDSVKDLVKLPERDGKMHTINPSQICRDKYGIKIYNRKEKKSYQVVYTKRVIQQNLDTLPFGY